MPSSMTAAFEKAGLTKHQMRAYATASEFIEQGGSLEDWIAVYRLAASKLPGAALRSLPRGRLVDAIPRQTNDSGLGLRLRADGGHASPARPLSLKANGGGHRKKVDKATDWMPLPVREPTATQVAATRAVAKSAALTALDRMKTSDGRPWGDVGAHELDGMDRDGAIARAIKSKLGRLTNAQRFLPLRKLMKPDEFERIAREVREVSNAA